MNTLTIPVRQEGALVEVAVGLSFPDAQSQRQASKPLPSEAAGLALIDTGAQVSAVDNALPAPLLAVGVQPLRFVFVNLQPTGANPHAVYGVTLTVRSASGGGLRPLTLRNHPVVAQDLGQLGFQAVLGRDVLARCLLVYDGPGRIVTLGY